MARKGRTPTLRQPPVVIHNVAVNEQIGRISVDGVVDGRPAAVVFMQTEIPASARTDEDLWGYAQRRLREAGQIQSGE